MEIVDHALHALSDEVLVPHSGWERGSNGAGGGEENCKPRHLEWETALTNTAGCLRYGQLLEERAEHLLMWNFQITFIGFKTHPEATIVALSLFKRRLTVRYSCSFTGIL